MSVKIGEMKNAGPYYGKTLDELGEMEWRPEEERLIERYCEKIHKNISQEEMTPMERFKATCEGADRDRLFVEAYFYSTYTMRIYDAFSGALKAIDAYSFPQLLILSHLACIARFNPDNLHIGGFSYGENMFGAPAMMIEDGSPVFLMPMPIKTIEDMEGLEAPDPTKYGLFPQLLWTLREVRRIFDKYELSGKLPIEAECCGSAEHLAMHAMLGYEEFIRAMRNNPDLIKATIKLGTDFLISLGKALFEIGKVDMADLPENTGMFPTKGYEWVADEFARLGKAVQTAAGPAPFVHGMVFDKCYEWLQVFWDAGALGPDSFDAVIVAGIENYERAIDFCKEHDLRVGSSPVAELSVKGPASAIEENYKKRCSILKNAKKGYVGAGPIDYWTPPEFMDVTIKAAKEYGKF
ncbi:MAG: hypothetical protein KKC46_16140 [Proteobacteria bacterium]|nr:hypothetical protein [Pseudomonadota bacterium]